MLWRLIVISFLLNFHWISSFHCLSSEQAWAGGRLGGWRVQEIRLTYLWGRDLRRLKYNFEMWQLNLSQIVRLIHEKYESHRLPFDVHVCAQLLGHVWPLWPHGLQPTRLPCPWYSPVVNSGVGCQFLLQGMFPTQGSNPGLLYLLYWQVDSLPLFPGKAPSESHQWSKRKPHQIVPF